MKLSTVSRQRSRDISPDSKQHPGSSRPAQRVANTSIISSPRSQTQRGRTQIAPTNISICLNLYQPNSIGASTYFATVEEIKSNVRQLAMPGVTISDEHIMALAEAAFKKKGHDTTSIARIQREYKALPTANRSYTAFKSHWNRELQLLWEAGDTGTEVAMATQNAAAMTAELRNYVKN